jgi:hypothetical protein
MFVVLKRYEIRFWYVKPANVSYDVWLKFPWAQENEDINNNKKINVSLILMNPCIVVWFSRNNQQDATLEQNKLFHLSLKAQHVSSGAPLIIRSSNCICSLRFTYAYSLHSVPAQTWLRPVTTCVCKPEAANTVRAPDDERCTARTMLSL